jgi:electron transport complex protein RnfB
MKKRTSFFVKTVLVCVALLAFCSYAGVGGGVEARESVDMGELLRFSLVFLAAMAAVFGVVLAFAARKFFVKTDPLVEKVLKVLAHAHCGACGYAGCEQYAEAVVRDPDVAPNLCTPGGKTCAELVAELTGKSMQEREPRYARVMCQGSRDKAPRKFTYEGVKDCRAAVLAAGGDKACPYGCLGYGTCVRACPFGALSMGDDGLPKVDIKKCTGCGKCAAVCPKKVIEILPASARVVVACHSVDKGAVTRRYCSVGCIGCGKCVKVCPVVPEKAPKVENFLSRIDSTKCIACGECVRNCPTKAIVSFVPPPQSTGTK